VTLFSSLGEGLNRDRVAIQIALLLVTAFTALCMGLVIWQLLRRAFLALRIRRRS